MTMLFTAPRSCLVLVQNFHDLYNQGSTDLGGLLHRDMRVRLVNPTIWLSDLRREHGAFIRTLSTGHSLSPASLTNLQVDLWLISEFERGRRQERFRCATGLFVALRILEVEINRMQQPKS
jgi:hypothetical protein